MRYATVAQVAPGSPLRVIGVGDSEQSAFQNARGWLASSLERANDEESRFLVALQQHLSVWNEEELLARTGRGLDEWLGTVTSGKTAYKHADSTEIAATKLRASLDPVQAKLGDRRMVFGTAGIALLATIFTVLLAYYSDTALPIDLIAAQFVISYFMTLVFAAFVHIFVTKFVDGSAIEFTLFLCLALQVIQMLTVGLQLSAFRS